MTLSADCRSQWPRGLRRGSASARLQRLWVRIPPAAWMSVCCECCVLSGRGLRVGLITRPEESYRVGVSECDHESSTMRRPWPTGDCCAMVKEISRSEYIAPCGRTIGRKAMWLNGPHARAHTHIHTHTHTKPARCGQKGMLATCSFRDVLGV